MALKNRVLRMKEMVEASQSEVFEISDLHEAFQYAIELTEKQGGKNITSPGLKQQDQATFEKWCIEKNLTLLTENLRNHLTGLYTGLTLIDWGIAETGTLVLESSAEDTRIATMLTEIHVAVLPRSRIKTDMRSLQKELKQSMKSPLRYLAFITGPSRTADIERVLTIGVHGPKELHVLIMRDDKP